MHIQIATLIELLVTNGAGERLFTNMKSTQRILFINLLELLVTIRTGERSFHQFEFCDDKSNRHFV